MFYTRPLWDKHISDAVLKADKAKWRKYGPCAVGEEALYLNSFYLDRRYYLPFSDVARVFKRVAMSKGGFTGKGIFASMPYLVVVGRNGQEKQCLFRYEEHVDAMLLDIEIHHPEILQMSQAVEERLQKRREKEAKKVRPVISEKAQAQIERLKKEKAYLEARPALSKALTVSAKAKRVNERSNPAYRWVALLIVLLGVMATLYGIYAVWTKADFGIYITLFGLAAVFLFAGANVLPTKRHNKHYIDQNWREACVAMEEYLKGYPDFLLPARYAHPVTITRMIRVIEDARAETAIESLQVVKEDLKQLNASVQVEQEEYDEIMAIKPMFLVEDYK